MTKDRKVPQRDRRHLLKARRRLLAMLHPASVRFQVGVVSLPLVGPVPRQLP
jgi:hypothetical protein